MAIASNDEFSLELKRLILAGAFDAVDDEAVCVLVPIVDSLDGVLLLEVREAQQPVAALIEFVIRFGLGLAFFKIFRLFGHFFGLV